MSFLFTKSASTVVAVISFVCLSQISLVASANETTQANPTPQYSASSSTLDRFTRDNQSKAFKIRGSTSLSFLRDSNANLGTDANSIAIYIAGLGNINYTISNANKPQSDNAYNLSSNISYQKYLGNGYGFLGSVQGSLVDYSSLHGRDTLNINARNGMTKSFGRDTLLYVPLVVAGTWLGSNNMQAKPLVGTYGVSPSITYRINNKFSISTEISLLHKIWNKKSEGSDYSNRNARFYSLSPSLTYSSGSVYMTATPILRTEKARNITFSKHSQGLSLYLGKKVTDHNLTLFFNPSVIIDKYDGRDILSKNIRNDKIQTVSTGFEYKLFGKTSTIFNISHIKSDSTVSFYSYTKNQVSIGLTQRF